MYEQYTEEESVSRVLAYIMMLLQFGQLVLAIVDLAVFTTNAYNDADILFGESIKDLKNESSTLWCVSLDDRTLKCLNSEKSDMAKIVVEGRRLPSFVGVSGAAASRAKMPPTSSTWPLPEAAMTAGMLVIGVAAVVIATARWARKRRV